MTVPSFPAQTAKSDVQTQVVAALKADHLVITDQNFDKPWGGYLVISEEQIEIFIQSYFADVASELLAQVKQGFKLTPKILVVAPQARLSWQYHFRRSEEWCVISADPIAVMQNQTDQMPNVPEIYPQGGRISLEVEQRHRLIGLDAWGVVAEIWCHTQLDHPSTEEDIIRVQDDYART
jgi:hypothetical protein